MSIAPTFSGEVQFRRYSDTSTQGVQITLSLHDREALEPLIHKAGKRFMAVLVEIGDDELPVAGNPASEKVKVGPLCREAIDLCKNPEFQRWVAKDTPYDGTEEAARNYILASCDVASRKELDWPENAGLFVDVVRIPFMKGRRA